MTISKVRPSRVLLGRRGTLHIFPRNGFIYALTNSSRISLARSCSNKPHSHTPPYPNPDLRTTPWLIWDPALEEDAPERRALPGRAAKLVESVVYGSSYGPKELNAFKVPFHLKK